VQQTKQLFLPMKGMQFILISENVLNVKVCLKTLYHPLFWRQGGWRNTYRLSHEHLNNAPTGTWFLTIMELPLKIYLKKKIIKQSAKCRPMI